LSYLRLYANRFDIQAFKRAVKIPTRGIGDVVIDKISDLSIKNGVDIFTVIKDYGDF